MVVVNASSFCCQGFDPRRAKGLARGVHSRLGVQHAENDTTGAKSFATYKEQSAVHAAGQTLGTPRVKPLATEKLALTKPLAMTQATDETLP